jgi:uncharacterized protein YdhG (YjbR/CyaY superfamily)
MKPAKARPKTVSEYIDASPMPLRKKLREMRACIRRAAPDAEEGLKWSMPAFSQGRILVMFGGFKGHLGFYPTAAAVKAFSKELSRFRTARGSIQFPWEKPLPVALIRRIVGFRLKQNRKKEGNWRS